MGIAGILLLLSDRPYHVKNWKTGMWGAGLVILVSLPDLIFRYQHPDAIVSQLRILDSYWTQSIPITDKVGKFISNLAYGLSPQYWFFTNYQDLARHLMKGYGNLPLWLSPLLVTGLLMCFQNLRSSVHRALLISALLAPVGGALAEISITRVLLFVVPASLIGLLGADAVIDRVRSSRVQFGTAVATFALLGVLSTGMLGDALRNGPTWFTNYGLYGMQWGARQLFTEAIPSYARQNPVGPIYLTSTWANGTDVFMRYFQLDPRVQMLNVDYFALYRRPLDPNAVFIMTKDEYDRAQTSHKFKPVQIEKTIQYADGSDGFYFARLSYVDNVDQILADELQARRKLVTEPVVIQGMAAEVAHSPLDIGRIQDVFDGDTFTLARGMEANPLIIDIRFREPQSLHGLSGVFGKMDLRWTLALYSPESDVPVEYQAQYVALPDEPHVEMRFDQGRTTVSRIRIEILDLGGGEPVHIHVRDLTFTLD